VTDDELDWLIRALGQRAEDSFVVAVPDHAAVWGACHFYGDRQCVQINGIEVALQPRQYSFALQLFRRTGKVVARDWLWRGIESPRVF